MYAGIRTRKEDIRDMLLTDVCPFTLGVEVWRRRGDGQNVLLPMIELSFAVCTLKVPPGLTPAQKAEYARAHFGSLPLPHTGFR